MSDLVPVSAAEGPATDRLHVVFKVAGADYALPASAVLQMESFTAATPVPGTAPFIVGIMPIRGQVVPVLDLRVRFGLPAIAATFDSRVIVAQAQHRTVALLVDSAREVVKIPPSDYKEPPRLMSDGAQAFVRAIVQLGNRILLVLDFAKVIGEESIDAS